MFVVIYCINMLLCYLFVKDGSPCLANERDTADIVKVGEEGEQVRDDVLVCFFHSVLMRERMRGDNVWSVWRRKVKEWKG